MSSTTANTAVGPSSELGDASDLDDADIDADAEVEPTSGEPAEDVDESPEEPATWLTKLRPSRAGLALIVAAVVVAVLGGYAGWAGFGVIQMRRSADQDSRSVHAASQLAVDLTSIDWQHPEADVQKIVDATTGAFRDDFKQRAPAFIDMVKQAKSKTVGSVTEAGLEPSSEADAQVLVTVAVATTSDGEPDQEQRAWRMRISVQKNSADPKVTNVVFVP